MNYKVYRKVISDVLMQNERNKTIQNKIKVLKELDNGNKELKKMIAFLTNELINMMIEVLEINNANDYNILIHNYQKLNIPIKIIDEIKNSERNVVEELCISNEDKKILNNKDVNEKLKIVATIIYNYNYLIEIIQIDGNIKDNINKLLCIKDMTALLDDESFISHYSIDVLKKIIKNNVFTNKEIIYLFNEYPNIFNYIDEDFELLTHSIIDQKKNDEIDKIDLNKIIGSMTYKLKL